jgi:hypothetical protein
MIDLIKICLTCEGHGTAPAAGFPDRIRALFTPRRCPVCEGRGEVQQGVVAERLAAELAQSSRYLVRLLIAPQR